MQDLEEAGVVRAPEGLSPPPGLLPRCANDRLSSLYLLDTVDETTVFVPKAAIVRTFNQPPLKRGTDLCLAGRRLTCSRGWKVPHPRDVIVVSARDTHGVLHFGWFVCFQDQPDRLVRLPFPIIECLARLVATTPELVDSSLNRTFTEAVFTAPRICFSSVLIARCRRFSWVLAQHTRHAHNAAGLKRRRAEQARVPDSPPANTCQENCSVCFEVGPGVENRCCTPMCTDCHEKLRHLCPVCERGDLNGFFSCGACDNAVPLHDAGFPCPTCKSCTLCRSCYHSFAECPCCDPILPDGSTVVCPS